MEPLVVGKLGPQAMKHGPRFIDLTGKRFGKLTVIGYHSKDHNRKLKWECRCDCGKKIVAYGNNLSKTNHTTSCGCHQADITRRRSTKHGHAPRSGRSKEFWAVHAAISRCENKSSKQWKWYGGKGIKVCRGLHDVVHLVRILGSRPEEKYSLGRIDNNGNYSCGSCSECVSKCWPLNVRWEDRLEQMNNLSRNHRVLHEGNVMTVAQLARHLGRPYKRVHYEVVKGAFETVQA